METIIGVISVLAIYLLGVFYTSGKVGKFRDGPDGLTDMFLVFFWPVVLFFKIIVTPFEMAYNSGKKKKEHDQIYKGK